MTDLFMFIVAQSCKAGILILGIFIVRSLLFRRLSPSVRHALWLLVPLCLLVSVPVSVPLSWVRTVPENVVTDEIPEQNLPVRETVEVEPLEPIEPIPDFEESVAEFIFVAQEGNGIESENAAFDDTLTATAVETEAAGAPEYRLNGVGVVSYVWGMGCGIMLLTFLRQIALCRRWVREKRLITDSASHALLKECAEKISVTSLPILAESESIPGPFVTGVFRPILLLPPGMSETASREQLRTVFLHELAHLKRRDVLLSWLMSVLLSVHWFNPLLWLAIRRMNTDREEACDSLALKNSVLEERKAYAHSLVDIAERSRKPIRTPGWIGISESGQFLQRRIEMIQHIGTWKTRWTLLAVLLTTFLAAVTMTDAQQEQALETPAVTEIDQEKLQEQEKDKYETEIIMPAERKVQEAQSKADREYQQEQLARKKIIVEILRERIRALESEQSDGIRDHDEVLNELVRTANELAEIKDQRNNVSIRIVSSNVQRVTNLRALMLAVHSYHDDHRGFPQVSTVEILSETPLKYRTLHSWRVLILPYLGEKEKELYDQIRLDEPWDSEHNKQFHVRMPEVFRSTCLTAIEQEKGYTNYAAVIGDREPVSAQKSQDDSSSSMGGMSGGGIGMSGMDSFGMVREPTPEELERLRNEPIYAGPGSSCHFGQITDGTSNTILFVERTKPVCWMEPIDVTYREALKGVNKSENGLGALNSPDGIFAVFADSAVRFLSNDTKIRQLKGMLTRGGGEDVSPLPDSVNYIPVTGNETLKVKLNRETICGIYEGTEGGIPIVMFIQKGQRRGVDRDGRIVTEVFICDADDPQAIHCVRESVPYRGNTCYVTANGDLRGERFVIVDGHRRIGPSSYDQIRNAFGEFSGDTAGVLHLNFPTSRQFDRITVKKIGEFRVEEER